jgi:hypothetical protein
MSENEKQATVPYFVHEGMVARMERMFRITVCALVIALAVCVVSLVVNDTLWREHCATLDARYQTVIEEVQNAGVYEQPDTGSD